MLLQILSLSLSLSLFLTFSLSHFLALSLSRSLTFFLSHTHTNSSPAYLETSTRSFLLARDCHHQDSAFIFYLRAGTGQESFQA